ncbi:MAG: 30S ribosomal protein S20 [Chitinophagales bacterium]|jgi:small subunit ribosomal protein S20|nr:30S ribosomal protein S20 [Chitinophagales bacterium]
MAHHKSAKKRIRQTASRRLRNRYYAKTTRNFIRNLRSLKDAKSSEEALPKAFSMVDKLAKRGYIHKNKAGNLKSKLSARIASLKK